MPTFFGSSPGQVIALTDRDGIVGLPLAIDGIVGSWFPGFKSVLTGLSVVLDGNFAAMQTLREIIYVYTFGDRISQFNIMGMCFLGSCAPGSQSGLELMLNYYRQNRIALRASPIQLAIGTNSAGRFTGFLTSFKADVIRPEQSVGTFSLQFTIFPGK